MQKLLLLGGVLLLHLVLFLRLTVLVLRLSEAVDPLLFGELVFELETFSLIFFVQFGDLALLFDFSLAFVRYLLFPITEKTVQIQWLLCKLASSQWLLPNKV